MRRLSVVIVLFVAMISATSGFVRAQEASPIATTAPGGAMETTVTVDGRALHVACIGTGGPTVLFEPGGPFLDGGTVYVTSGGSDVAAALGVRFCAYDRAGSGQSDPHPMGVRTFAEAAADLQAVLVSPDLGCPCVVVAASMGGGIAQVALAEDASAFAGLVLLDAVYPGLVDELLAIAPAGSTEAGFESDPSFTGENEERLDLVAGFRQVSEPAAPPAIPIVVASHGVGDPPPCFPCSASFPVAEWEAAWQAGQAKLARALGARLVIAEETSHFIAEENVELFLALTAEVIAAVRNLGAAATPETANQGARAAGPLDLAAMALAPEDAPTGFFDDYGELLTPGAAISDLVLGGAPTPPGLERTYQTFYVSPRQGAAVHVYLFEFASPDQAEAGAAVVDAALRPPLPEGTTFGPTHTPGPALGEEPRTLTVVAYDAWAAGGPRVDVVAATFRRGSLIAGVSVERYADPPPDGTLAAAVATPGAPDPAQAELAAALAATLDGRITAVLAGAAPAGADLALPPRILPLDRLAGDAIPILGGYKSGLDLLRCGICGEENALAPFAVAARGGFVRAAALGPLVDGEPAPPFVAVAVTAFVSPQDALAALATIRRAPNDRPTPYPVPRGRRTLTAAPAIPGAASAVAVQAALDAENPNAPIDSAGVSFVVDAWLVTVDVQGRLSADAALAVAVDLATQQAACLTSSDPCATVTRPPALGEASEAWWREATRGLLVGPTAARWHGAGFRGKAPV